MYFLVSDLKCCFLTSVAFLASIIPLSSPSPPIAVVHATTISGQTTYNNLLTGLFNWASSDLFEMQIPPLTAYGISVVSLHSYIVQPLFSRLIAYHTLGSYNQAASVQFLWLAFFPPATGPPHMLFILLALLSKPMLGSIFLNNSCPFIRLPLILLAPNRRFPCPPCRQITIIWSPKDLNLHFITLFILILHLWMWFFFFSF